MRQVDVAVVGGGPAGLATAIVAAGRGLSTSVFDKRPIPSDKACGEGLLPAGVAALEDLGARDFLPADGWRAFHGIRWLQEDGRSVTARFSAGVGLGIRRLALVEALSLRAVEYGATLHGGEAVLGLRQTGGEVFFHTEDGPWRARILVAADGLGSPTRRRLGLEGSPPGRRRYGLRRHFRMRPWSDHVDIHWSAGAEAYVTPVGPEHVGVALLWDGAVGKQRFDRLIDRFPALQERLQGAQVVGHDRGAGPLARRAQARTAGRVLLVGDAAGYVDALSGEGLALAFGQALALAPHLPDAVVRGAPALRPWVRQADEAFTRYALLTRMLLLLSENPSLRRTAVRLFAARPHLFETALGLFVRAPARPIAQLRAAP